MEFNDMVRIINASNLSQSSFVLSSRAETDQTFAEALGQGPQGAARPASFGILRACADDLGAALLP